MNGLPNSLPPESITAGYSVDAVATSGCKTAGSVVQTTAIATHCDVCSQRKEDLRLACRECLEFAVPFPPDTNEGVAHEDAAALNALDSDRLVLASMLLARLDRPARFIIREWLEEHS